MSREKLLLMVRAALQDAPMLAGDLLQLVAEFMPQYQEQLRRQRAGQAANALTALAGMVRHGTANIDAAWLFDYILLQYPSGLGHRTGADDYLRDVYLAYVRRDIDDHKRWLQTVRSWDDQRYFEQHVEPVLKAGEQ